MTTQEVIKTVPLFVFGRDGLILRIERQFAELPGVTKIGWNKAHLLSANKWRKELGQGPVVVTVYNSPWLLVELCDEQIQPLSRVS